MEVSHNYPPGLRDTLIHYGVKGMHWGIRRTPAQLGHKPSSGKGALGIFQKKPAAKQNTAKKAAAEKAEAKRQEELSAEAIRAKKELILQSRDPKLLYQNAHLFDNRELGDAYLRLNTEKNIKSLIPKEVSRGQKFIDGYLKVGKTVNEVLDVSVKIGENIQKANKLLTGSSGSDAGKKKK